MKINCAAKLNKYKYMTKDFRPKKEGLLQRNQSQRGLFYDNKNLFKWLQNSLNAQCMQWLGRIWIVFEPQKQELLPLATKCNFIWSLTLTCKSGYNFGVSTGGIRPFGKECEPWSGEAPVCLLQKTFTCTLYMYIPFFVLLPVSLPWTYPEGSWVLFEGYSQRAGKWYPKNADIGFGYIAFWRLHSNRFAIYSKPTDVSSNLITLFISSINNYIFTSLKIHSTVMRTREMNLLKAAWRTFMFLLWKGISVILCHFSISLHILRTAHLN